MRFARLVMELEQKTEKPKSAQSAMAKELSMKWFRWEWCKCKCKIRVRSVEEKDTFIQRTVLCVKERRWLNRNEVLKLKYQQAHIMIKKLCLKKKPNSIQKRRQETWLSHLNSKSIIYSTESVTIYTQTLQSVSLSFCMDLKGQSSTLTAKILISS